MSEQTKKSIKCPHCEDWLTPDSIHIHPDKIGHTTASEVSHDPT